MNVSCRPNFITSPEQIRRQSAIGGMPQISDLVSDSELVTSLLPNGAIHTFTTVTDDRQYVSWQDHWTRQRLLGEGGFGRVWLEACTRGRSQGGLRAVKMVRKTRDASSAIDYNRELEAVAKFSQSRYEACFVKSFGWFECTEAVYITMEYLPHGDLHLYLRQVRSILPPEEARQVVYQTLEGLEFMHANNFAHRDIKPSNILIKACPPRKWWIKLADFGISKRAEDENGPSTIKGTQGFMAPELQGFGKVSGKEHTIDFQAADLWALGEVAFRILHGEPAFQNSWAFAAYSIGQERCPSSRLATSAGEHAIDFVSKLLAVVPQVRLKASDALRHPWIDSLRKPPEDVTQFMSHPLTNTLLPVDSAARSNALPSILIEEASAGFGARRETENGQTTHCSKLEPVDPASIWHGDPTRYSTEVSSSSNHEYGSSLGTTSSFEQIHQSMPEVPSIEIETSSAVNDTVVGGLSRPSLNDRHESDENPMQTLLRTPPSQERHLVPLRPKQVWQEFITIERRLTLRGFSPGHKGAVSALSFSADGTLLSASSDKTVQLWDCSWSVRLQVLSGHRHAITSVNFLPDGVAASCSTDGIVKLWQCDSGQPIKTFRLQRRVQDFAFSPSGEILASASRSIELWSYEHERLLRTLPGHTELVHSVSFSADGEMLASASRDRTIKLWDSKSGDLLRTLTGHSESVYHVAFSPNSATLASASEDKTVKMWDCETGRLLMTLSNHKALVNNVAFSPGGDILASASNDGTIGLHDIRSGTLIDRLKGPWSCAVCVSFSPDGGTLASGWKDGIIRLWRKSA